MVEERTDLGMSDHSTHTARSYFRIYRFCCAAYFTVQAAKSSKVKVKLLMENNEEEVLICWETLFDGSQRVLRFWEKDEEYA